MWLTAARAAGRPGAVYLATRPGPDVTFSQAVPENTLYLADAEFGEFNLTPSVAGRTRVTLQMTARGHAWFGEKRTVTLLPDA